MTGLRQDHFFVWRARNWSARFKVRVTPSQLAHMWIRQQGRCALSGRPLGRDAHLDHVVPQACGRHDITNLRWLDPAVNVARQNMDDSEFVALCRDVAVWSKP
jgi:5-methylcytosine-specific restriction endonuclease McrA